MLAEKLLIEEVREELHQLDAETFEVEDLLDLEQTAASTSSSCSTSCGSTTSSSTSCSSCCSCSSSSCCSCSCWHF
ncbi:MAG TPA: hypothetical protein VFA09_25480 [Ktedonobacteraceae bacterium]|nr:hypothetical protein [Ktedonobacteraceae bacterium]